MAEITTAGIQPTDLTGYRALVESSLQQALGADLNLASETPQGQIAGVLALVFAELDELAVYAAAGLSLEQAAGRQLRDIAVLAGVPFIQGERSSVTATLTGTASTFVPAGSRARTASGNVFRLESAKTIGSGGTVDGLFRAEEIGPIAVAVGELSTIVDIVTGWNSLTNAAAASVGRNEETDAEYRRRYRSMATVHARDALESIRARVLEADGVTRCLVRENATGASVTVQSVAIDARSILAIVEGGADADIGAAISATKPAGVATTGDVTVQVPHAQGFNIPIKFRRVTTVALQVAITLSTTALFPSTGLATIRQNLLDWFDGNWEPAAGLFDQSGVGIGEELDTNRLLSPIQAVPGHAVTTLTVERDGGSALGTPDLDERYTLASDKITFTIS